ncbi:MAG: tRNA (adenosine(37)-N6)-threonylcarbamoyltransferase complex ATPase subunit type 1 TsaE [Candidatus Aegiribacteria sp.]|nr:tRNA (adenosine(37)-N6)-threonylcarbamoyltransferase complex ATPase subunit type 1 TsaE [Candidatus Aegiribacteria sp.]
MDQAALEELAREIACNITSGSKLFLSGGLGAGKSVFARAVLRELGIKGSIPSPSFIVDAVYSSRGLEIHHIDLYRLEGSPDEMAFYGIYEVLESEAVVIVEWAERLDAAALEKGTLVSIDFTGDSLMREVRVDDRSLAGN